MATMTLTIPKQGPTSLSTATHMHPAPLRTSPPPSTTTTHDDMSPRSPTADEFHTPPAHSCPNCGFPSQPPPQPDLEAELAAARQRIADLESQVLQLNHKAAAAIDRWADYEDELTRLRSQTRSPTSTHPSTVSSPLSPKEAPPPPVQPSPTTFNRLSALLGPRKSTPNLRETNPAPGHEVEDLLQALNRETGLRRAAEARLSKTSEEVEELSAALFEQANEMVAEERRMRARLEERLGVLEKREGDRRRRLERLEGALERIRCAKEVLSRVDEGEGVIMSEGGHERDAERDVVHMS